MSLLYDALKRLETRHDPAPATRPTASEAARPAPLDAIRLEQFLDLQNRLLLTAGDPALLPERLVHAVGTFLGLQGAAVGVLRGGTYHLVATYGAAVKHHARYDGASLEDGELAAVLTARRPVVIALPGTGLRDLVLPLRIADDPGALHLARAGKVMLADEDIALARALAGLVGIALANADQRRRLA